MSTEQTTCGQCGNPMPANARFCPECGASNPAMSGSTPAPQAGNPTVHIGSAGFAPPASPVESEGWQPGRYAPPTDAPPTPPPAYSHTPVGSPPEGTGARMDYAASPTQQSGELQSYDRYAAQSQPPAPGYGNYPPPAQGYPYGAITTPRRDPTVAMLLELLGYLGFLGIGHMYGGKIGRGITLLVGFWLYLALSTVLIIVLVGCAMLLFAAVIPIISGVWIRRDLERENAALTPRN